MKSCPECLSEIPQDAAFCRCCGERIAGKRCPDCGSRCWDAARKCRWCSHEFESPAAGPEFEPFSVTARFLPTVLQRGRFLRQRIDLSREKIVVSTPGLFGLSRRDEEIPWKKVAGFDYRSGIFWDTVTVETRGQSSSAIPCLSKEDGARIRSVLQQLER
jgi:hypothetical protein